MKLQARTTLVPFFTVSVLCIGLYLLVSQVTIGSFNQLESAILQKQVERVNNSISNLVDEHANKIVDWAQWDRTYDFMQSLDKSYIEANLNPLTLSALGFTSAMYFTPESALKYGVTVVGGEVQLAESALIEETKSIIAQSKAQSFQGLVRLNGATFMLAASPILPNMADQKSRGVLVALSKITPETFTLIEHLTNLSLKFWPTEEIENDIQMQPVTAELANGAGAVVKQVSNELSLAFGVVSDVHKKPALYYQVNDKREIVSAGYLVRDISIAILLGVGALAIILLAMVIHLSAAKRIEQFSAQVRGIAANSDSSGRLIDRSTNSRSLRFKTAGGVLLVFVIMTVLASTILSQYFLQGFEKIEDKVMGDNLERASRALKGRLDKLQGKAIDWGQWDDSYQFIEDGNEDYRSDNLGFDTLGSMNLKYVLYFNSATKLVDGREIAVGNESVIPIDSRVAESIAAVPALSRAIEPTAGFLSLPSGTILAAASPILDTERAKPARGALIFASLADDKLAGELGRQARLNLSFVDPVDDIGSTPRSIYRISANEIEGRAVILDLLNKPAISVAVRSARPVYEQGLLAAKVLPLYFMLGGIICALVTLVWIDRILLSRIRRICGEAEAIRSLDTKESKVTEGGTDEISGLARDINSMLVALQSAQQELAKAKDAAVLANNAKSLFIARVSHELRNPIHGIRGINELILRREESKAVRDLVKMGDSAAEGLISIVDEILDYSKAEAGELTFEKISFDLRQVVRETMVVIAARLEGKYKPGDKGERVQLVCNIHPDIPQKLEGDPTRLKQILINLLANSVKFTSKGFVGLKIEAEWLSFAEVRLIIDVWDTGIGIPNDKLATIFKPFKQADETVTRRYQGTGLGLSIAKQFTEGLGGTVSVKSTEGQGSTFTISLVQRILGDNTSYLRSIVPHHRFPTETIIVARPSPVFSPISKALSDLGAPTAVLDPFVGGGDSSELRQLLIAADLLVLSEEALSRATIMNILEQRLLVNKGCNIAIINPSSLDLRERMYGLGMKYVLSTPILADDLLLAYIDELPQVGTNREGCGSSPQPQFKRKLKILIADDAPPNRFILQQMLEDVGHQVTAVCDGKEIVDLLRPMIAGQSGAQHFDVVISDISMTIMDGDEATRIIRELEKEHRSAVHIPIIAITGHAFKEEQEKILAAGVDGVLVKPMTTEMLGAALMRLFGSEMLTSQPKPHAAASVRPHSLQTVENSVERSLCEYVRISVCELADPSSISNVWSEDLIDIKQLYKKRGRSLGAVGAILESFDASCLELVNELRVAKEKQETARLGEVALAMQDLFFAIESKFLAIEAGMICLFCRQRDLNRALEIVTDLVDHTNCLATIVKKLSKVLATDDCMAELALRTSAPLVEGKSQGTGNSTQRGGAPLNRANLEEAVRLRTIHSSRAPTEIIDLVELRQRCGGKDSTIIHVLDSFVEAMQPILPKLRMVEIQKDRKALVRMLHAIKGLFRDAGAISSADVVEQIEHKLRDANYCVVEDLDLIEKVADDACHNARALKQGLESSI